MFVIKDMAIMGDYYNIFPMTIFIEESTNRTCSDLLYKFPNFFKFHELNINSYDHVAEVLLFHNC